MSQPNSYHQDSLSLDCQEILPRLFLGSEDAAYSDVDILLNDPYRISHICVCGFGLSRKYEQHFKYFQIKAVDLPIYNITQDVLKCVEFIDEALNQNENNHALWLNSLSVIFAFKF
ncbi:hypothetical protein FDP41_004257 [Naegleria fowleri]|uniref:Uncharacterized protein n=1 Tax=Naegleria fowleri TaxID=5763 RepID=A0A6A5BQ74_NAEFO|nr:uncharacterized protein FDP41_004257 [Naegleria fowleri]KAF0976962.1 hypothetical protein FDP41_004257 [Naegleria fowleri]